MQHVRFTSQQIRILGLAHLIEQLPDHLFNMECWLHEDYGPSCIAGWAVWEMVGLRHDRRDIMRSMSIPEEAARYLGVYGLGMRSLFTPVWTDLHDGPPTDDEAGNEVRRRISKRWAAATLRHLAATGEVDWKAAKRLMRAPPCAWRPVTDSYRWLQGATGEVVA
ncbi:hypothetical protein V3589_14890 [Sinorhizobium fredii]|uniref:hypothetical protein n=1 Tax=Rhizobium fredii TaxID=380 RepID=UPI00309A0F6D